MSLQSVIEFGYDCFGRTLVRQSRRRSNLSCLGGRSPSQKLATSISVTRLQSMTLCRSDTCGPRLHLVHATDRNRRAAGQCGAQGSRADLVGMALLGKLSKGEPSRSGIRSTDVRQPLISP